MFALNTLNTVLASHAYLFLTFFHPSRHLLFQSIPADACTMPCPGPGAGNAETQLLARSSGKPEQRQEGAVEGT